MQLVPAAFRGARVAEARRCWRRGSGGWIGRSTGQIRATLRCYVKLRMIKKQERPGAVLWYKACLMNIARGKRDAW